LGAERSEDTHRRHREPQAKRSTSQGRALTTERRMRGKILPDIAFARTSERLGEHGAQFTAPTVIKRTPKLEAKEFTRPPNAGRI